MTNKIKYISIDDNPVDTLLLQHYAAEHPFLQHINSFDSAVKGMEAIEALQPDLVFLDVEMPEATGLEVLRFIKE